MKKVLIGFLILTACVSRKFDNSQGESSTEAVGESAGWYGATVSAPASVRPVYPLSGDSLNDVLDIRGVGDSAWASIRGTYPAPSKMGYYLNQFDPSKEILKGDLNFMNIETTIASQCNSWYPVDFGFLSEPKSVSEAIAHGFNIFGVANNHTEDCRIGTTKAGALHTRDNLNKLAEGGKFMWHGAGEGVQLTTPVTKVYKVKGREVTVAFASVAFHSWYTDFTTRGEREIHGTKILQAMRALKADMKILAVHTEGKFDTAKQLAADFIKYADGDVVFQHGPHTWAGVKVIKKDSDGKQGVIFHGLGNFIHSGCSDNPDNLIGRALFDINTMSLKQVQVIPILNHFNSGVSLRSASSRLPISNLNWTSTNLKATQNVPAAFANLN